MLAREWSVLEIAADRTVPAPIPPQVKGCPETPMDYWTRELEKWLEPIAREVEATVETVTTQVDQWLEQSVQDFEQAATELQTQVETHLAETWGLEVDRLRRDMEASIDQWMADWFSPFWDDDWPDATPPHSDPDTAPGLNQYDALYDQLNPKVPPSPDRHAACIGCRHYHGRVYNDQLLVCGMYPFGWDAGACPDWEAGPSDRG